MFATIGSLKDAMITLGKQNSGSSLKRRETLAQVSNVIRRMMERQPSLVTRAV